MAKPDSDDYGTHLNVDGAWKVTSYPKRRRGTKRVIETDLESVGCSPLSTIVANPDLTWFFCQATDEEIRELNPNWSRALVSTWLRYLKQENIAPDVENWGLEEGEPQPVWNLPNFFQMILNRISR
jgi:hypothetical protein